MRGFNILKGDLVDWWLALLPHSVKDQVVSLCGVFTVCCDCGFPPTVQKWDWLENEWLATSRGCIPCLHHMCGSTPAGPPTDLVRYQAGWDGFIKNIWTISGSHSLSSIFVSQGSCAHTKHSWTWAIGCELLGNADLNESPPAGGRDSLVSVWTLGQPRSLCQLRCFITIQLSIDHLWRAE